MHTVPTPAGLQMGTPPHTPPCLVIGRPWPEFEPRNPWHGWVVILWCCFTSILGEAVRVHTVPTPAGLQMETPPHTPPCLIIGRPWPEFEPRNPWYEWVVILWCCFTLFTSTIVLWAPFISSHTFPQSLDMKLGVQPCNKY